MCLGTVLLVLLLCGGGVCQFINCHDDPSFDPDEGPLSELQFTWLGALQYIHVKKGNPHYFRVPRVVLISRQFALSTAVDAAQIPDGYALGNIVFGNYERDEEECRVTIEDLAAGSECEAAILLMPIADVLLHPQYKHFGATNSVALLKLFMPVKSKYMLPACLPFRNLLVLKNGKQIKEKLYHIDFESDVPRDFIDEEKEVLRVSLLPDELCNVHDNPENMTGMPKECIGCTTGCGLHSGAPSAVHEHTGHWSVVALALGGPPCPDPLRRSLPPPPPRHILLHPYVPWITTAITGKSVGTFAKDDPFGFIMPRSSNDTEDAGLGWIGHWWLEGIRCYDRGQMADRMFRFYHEVFQIKPGMSTYMEYYIDITAGHDIVIGCVKIGMPYRLSKPRVWEMETAEIKIRIPLMSFKNKFKFHVEAWGFKQAESSEEVSEEDKKN